MHPTLRCNLRCAHCYSSSSPAHRTDLDTDSLVATIRYLAGEGYRTLSISGGEPFLYRDLPRLAAESHQAGLKVHAITNGTVRSPAFRRSLGDLLDLVAVSIDGDPEQHDRIRGRRGAHSQAVLMLRQLADAGVRTAVVSCVTRSSLSSVPDLYELCAREGVGLLSLRPVVSVGRATALLTTHDEGLSQENLLRLHFLRLILDREGGPRVRADVVSVAELCAIAPLSYPFLEEGGVDDLVANVNPIVIREDGGILPYVYGLPDEYLLGTAAPDTQRLSVEILQRLPTAAGLVQAALTKVPTQSDTYFDWFAHVLHTGALEAAHPGKL